MELFSRNKSDSVLQLAIKGTPHSSSKHRETSYFREAGDQVFRERNSARLLTCTSDYFLVVQPSVPLLPEGHSWDDTTSILPASN
jgi:hypothetical protein